LGKAYDGNTTALGKLGLGLDANLLKSKDNEAIIKSLETTSGRFAEGAAETAAVKFERIRIATDEAKESIGAALLPVVEELSDYVLTTVVPNLESFINGLTGQGSLTEASANATDGAFKFGEQVKKIIKTIISLKDEILIVTGLIAGMFVVSKITAAVTATITLIRTIITAYNALKASAIVAGVASYFALNPLAGVAAVAVAAAVLAAANALAGNSNVDTSNLSAPSTGAIPFKSGFKAPSTPTITSPTITTPTTITGGGISTASQIAATAAAATSNVVTGSFNAGSFRQAEARDSGNNYYNINVTGAIDSIGTARTIANVLNAEATNSGTFSNLGSSLLVAL
jgi:heptaprenylglyceryl phosphate synthase